jgi:hypothetical protein
MPSHKRNNPSTDKRSGAIAGPRRFAVATPGHSRTVELVAPLPAFIRWFAGVVLVLVANFPSVTSGEMDGDYLIDQGLMARLSVRARSVQEVEDCARIWVEARFKAQQKTKMRDQLWPGVKWEYHSVHAVVRDPHESKTIVKEGITLHPFHSILAALSQRKSNSFSGSAGGDLAEFVSYYKSFDSKK